jgi:hypothetical protein
MALGKFSVKREYVQCLKKSAIITEIDNFRRANQMEKFKIDKTDLSELKTKKQKRKRMTIKNNCILNQ